MIVESYSNFIGTNVDPKIIESVLNLNNSEEFKTKGISIIHNKGVEKSFISKIRDFKKDKKNHFAVSYLDKIGGQICSFTIHKISSNDNFNFIYTISKFGNDKAIVPDPYGTLTTETKGSQLLELIKSEILSKHLSAVAKRNRIKAEKDAAAKAENEKKERRRKAEAERIERIRKENEKRMKDAREFEAKFNVQFFEDQFANVFDICDSHQIQKFSLGSDINIFLFFKTTPFKIENRYRKDGGGNGYYYDSFGEVNDTTADIVSELASCAGRMKEEGFLTYYGFVDNGIRVILRPTVRPYYPESDSYFRPYSI